MNIAVHHKWAPVGADHFVKMVKDGYFSSKVALFRCMKNFLCQFGIAGTPELNKRHGQNLVDDPNWLPEGPTHRTNDQGVKRFAKGYMAYAGGGKNTRGNQLIVSLVDVGSLAGGSPWEVPWGELVGTQSFDTLDKIYTGYGEKGPPQGLLSREGSSENVKNTWPLMDYMTACTVVDEM
jgi:cyclophilin family peptidyl-prolyl cis-trans isomerase